MVAPLDGIAEPLVPPLDPSAVPPVVAGADIEDDDVIPPGAPR